VERILRVCYPGPEWRNGRRSGLKIRRGQPRASSNLASGTVRCSGLSLTSGRQEEEFATQAALQLELPPIGPQLIRYPGQKAEIAIDPENAGERRCRTCRA
jgi:hypothetical protein